MNDKLMSNKLILTIFFFFPFSSSYSETRSFKGDIDWISQKSLKIVSKKISPDKKEITPLRNPSFLGARFYINKLGKLTKLLPMELVIKSENKKLKTNNPPITLENCQINPNSLIEASFKLETPFFSVQQRKIYELKVSLKCGHMNTFSFDFDGHSGQALTIFNISKKAVLKMKKHNIIGFWNKKIKIIYPGRGDYYSYGKVNLTKGHYWDVVGHELGHAVYDMANIGTMEGGPHRIDECYSKGLALSEGWASFFSAWLSVDLKDEDAKFEYMVPRRAPLRFENIPSDVCPGETNEWRVTGFLWDLIDINEDQEDTLKIPFKNFWKFTLKKGFKSTSSIYKSMLKSGFSPLLLNPIWEQNFLNRPKNISI